MSEESDQRKIIKRLFGKEDKPQKPVYIADLPDLVDIVENKYGDIVWLFSDGGTGDERFIDGVLYKPPPRNLLPPNLAISRLEEIQKYTSDHEESGGTGESGKSIGGRGVCFGCQMLFEDLLKYHKNISALPGDDYYLLLASWDFHTYCQERAEYSPIIYLYSVAERGKSRTAKGMVNVAYRGIRKGDIRDAQLIRDCTRLKATIAFDMTDFWEKVKLAGSQDVVLNRYERGLTVSRINRPEKGPFEDTDYFDVFGPTVLATNVMISDIAETRSLPIVMIRSEKEFSENVTPDIALPYKERLTAFRLIHRHDAWQQPQKIAKHRLGDIIRPLYQVIENIAPQYKDSFKTLTNTIIRKKLSDKSNSIYGDIVEAIGSSYLAVDHDILPNQSVVIKINQGKPEREWMAAKKVSNIIKLLGFEYHTTNNHAAGFLWDEGLVKKLREEYGLSSIDLPDLPDSSVSPDEKEASEFDNLLD